MNKLINVLLITLLLYVTAFSGRKDKSTHQDQPITVPPPLTTPQVAPDKTPQDNSNQLTISFDTPEAKAKFEKLLKATKDSLRVTQKADSNSYTISVDSAPPAPVPILSPAFATPTFPKPVNMGKNATITLFTPFHDLAHFETLFITKDEAHFNLRPTSPNTLTLKAKNNQFDAFNIASQLNMYAKTHPARLHSILGPIKGIGDVALGKAAMIQGVNPLSLSELTVSYPSKAPQLHPTSLQLLHFFGSPYRGVRKSSNANTSLLTYMGDTALTSIKELIIVHGNEKDPMIALSTNQGSGVLLYDQSNILLVKRRFSSLQLREIDRRLYFVSINEIPISNRLALRSAIAKQQIATRITTPALPLTSLTQSLSNDTLLRQETTIMPQQMPTKITLIFDPSDILATEASSLIMSTLKSRGVSVSVPARTYKEYQERLLLNAYDMAVAAISQKLVTTKIGADYLGRHWFRNKKDEKDRLIKEYEIPLFSVPVYLATKSDIAVPYNNLRLMHQTIKMPTEADSLTTPKPQASQTKPQ